jgi:hypothetical protein
MAGGRQEARKLTGERRGAYNHCRNGAEDCRSEYRGDQGDRGLDVLPESNAPALGRCGNNRQANDGPDVPQELTGNDHGGGEQGGRAQQHHLILEHQGWGVKRGFDQSNWQSLAFSPKRGISSLLPSVTQRTGEIKMMKFVARLAGRAALAGGTVAW